MIQVSHFLFKRRDAEKKSFHAVFRVMLKHFLEVTEGLPHGSAYSYNAFGMPLPTLMVSENLYNSAPLRLVKTYES